MRDYKIETEQRIGFIREQLKNANAEGIIFGNSGGKDSALVGILCKKACENTVGVIMPCVSASNYGDDKSDALALAEQFNIETRIVDLTDTAKAIKNALGGAEELTVGRAGEIGRAGGLTVSGAGALGRAWELDGVGELTVGGAGALGNVGALGRECELTATAEINIAPRLRMTTLYAIASSENRLVAGTGNKSEIYMGYFTKWGDGACDFNPIADLAATEIFEYLRYLDAPLHIIEKKPSAGLFDGQTDENEMGVTYKAIDEYLKSGVCDPKDLEIIERYHGTSAHKRGMPTRYGGN